MQRNKLLSAKNKWEIVGPSSENLIPERSSFLSATFRRWDRPSVHKTNKNETVDHLVVGLCLDMSVLTAVNSDAISGWVLRAWTASWAIMMLSWINLSLTKADWFTHTRSFRNGCMLLTNIFDTIFYKTEQRRIGLKSAMFSGFRIFGIRQR